MIVLQYRPGKQRGQQPPPVIVAKAPFTPTSERPAQPDRRKPGRPRKEK